MNITHPFLDSDGDKLREECGVFGVIGSPEAAAITAAKATAGAAEAATIAATKTVTTAEAIATARKRIEAVFTEPVALVTATAATSSIKTHKPERTFVSSASSQPRPRGRNAPGRQTRQTLARSAAVLVITHLCPLGESNRVRALVARATVTFLPKRQCKPHLLTVLAFCSAGARREQFLPADGVPSRVSPPD